MKRSSLLVLAVALLTLVAGSAPAHAAAGTWGPPTTVSPAGLNAFNPQLVVLTNGTIVATWDGDNGVDNSVLVARSTNAGATWSAPVSLSAAGVYAYGSQLGVAANGTITATWRGDSMAQAATSTNAGLTWSAPVDLSAAGQNANTPRIVVASDGTIAVTWELDDGLNRVVQATTSTNGGVTWSAPVTLSDPSDDADTNAVGVADSGVLFAVWAFNGVPSRTIQVSRSLDDGATWSLPYDLSASGGSAYNPRLETSPDGTITATWQRYGLPDSIVQTSRSADGGATWSAPVDLSAVGEGSYDAQVAVADDGTIAVTWVRGDGAERIVQASTSLNGGATWSAPADLSAAGFYSDAPQLAVSADGTFTVAWKRNVGANSILEVATLSAAGASWSAPLQLSQSTGSVDQIDVAAGTGAVTVAWQRNDGLGANSVQASTLPVTAAAVPGLAPGGTDVAPVALAGAVLLALGGALVLRRRRYALSCSVTA